MNDDERTADSRSDEIRRLEELVGGPSGAMAFPLLAEAHRRAGRPEEAERVARDGLEHAPQVTAGRVALALALLDQKRGDELRVELERLLGADPAHVIARDAAAQDDARSLALVGNGESLTMAGEGERSAARPHGEIATRDPYPLDEAFGGETSPFGTPPPPAAAQPLVFDGGAVQDEELDGAFAEAESDPEEMFGADDVAQAALAAVPEEAEDDAFDEAHPRSFVDAVTAATDAPFATETVAGLLEQQGHGAEAETLRARIGETARPEALETEPFSKDEDGEIDPPATQTTPVAEASDASPRRSQVTLERWLDNLRRDRP